MNEPLKTSDAPTPTRFNWHTAIGVGLTVFVWMPILIAAAIALLAS